MVIVVSNPLDEMTALTQLATGFPKARVIGQAGMLDTARFTNFVAAELDVPVGSVRTLTLGSHGDTMVPVPSQCTVRSTGSSPLSDLMSAERIDELVDAHPQRRRRGGRAAQDRVGLLRAVGGRRPDGQGGADDSGAVMPVCAWVDGEYGITGVYLGVEAEIGAGGVQRVVETELTDDELAALREAAEAVRAKQADVADL